ncbi:DUF4011 domain-containing protein [Aristaeella lactis]|uniref:AAA domain-containing protein n=1 Tax=Aristaeella lactis TaxID=3046383 RepID=A0AC61PLI1_9FIRM|nr:DUF4011 domain-containing protein [Aristaeella lactis]QUA54662.1 DUF4011 domain-containing protein [Aristaeella lactis]SMC63711.1 AAA domain-containing protein [Aristaeella lactis]
MSEAKTDRVIERKLDSMKKQLLDTGKRNRMINYRETKRATLRIVTPTYKDLFDRLAIKEESLSFQHPIDQDYDLRAYHFLTLMKTLGHEIPVRIGDIETNVSTPSEQKTTLRNLRSKARLAQEEQGTNILYLSFGFIKWREKNSTTSPVMVSPLIMVPASLTIKELNAPYMLNRYDDDIVVNPTLSYKFEHEFNLTLPEFEASDENSLDKYFSKIEKIVDQRGWQLIREVSLGLVSFLKISMYYDLEKKHDWLMKNPNIRALCGDPDAIQLPEEAAKLNNPDMINPIDQYQVIDADSSQQKAIQLSKMGVSFVMQGPPGTGKSQTITNIIAEALASGKKVLFVSEKAAALEVVLRRLKEAHISDFCLSLHDYKANKRDVLKQIGDNLRMKKIAVKNTATNNLVRLAKRRDELNTYAKELHETIQPLNISLYEAFGELAQYIEPVDFVCEIKNVEKISEIDFQMMSYNVGRYIRAFEEMSCGFADNPWRGTLVKTTSTLYLTELKTRTSNLPHNIAKTVAIMAIPIGPDSCPDATLGDVKEEIEKLSLTLRIPIHSYQLHSMSVPARKKLLLAAKTARLTQSAYQETLYECKKVYDNSVFKAPFENWLMKFNQYLQIIKCYSGWFYSSDEMILNQLDAIVEKAKKVDIRIQPILRDIKTFRSVAALSTEDDDISLHEAASFLNRLNKILDISSPFIPCWLNAKEVEEAKTLLMGAADAVQKQNATGNEIEKHWLSGVLQYESKALQNKCLSVISTIRNRKMGILLKGNVAEELEKTADEARQTQRKLEQYTEAANQVMKCFNFDMVDTWKQMEFAKELAQLVSESSSVLPLWFNQTRRNDATSYLQEAEKKTKLYKDKMELLSKEWDIGIVNIDAKELLSRFKKKYGGLFGHIKAQYKKDLASIQIHSKNNNTKYTDEQLIKMLYQVRDAQDVLSWFTENEVILRGAFGRHYHNVDSNWKEIASGLNQAQHIVNTVDRYKGLSLPLLSNVLEDEQNSKAIQEISQSILTGSNLTKLQNELISIHAYNTSSNISFVNTIIPILEALTADCYYVSQYVREMAQANKEGVTDLTLSQIEKLAQSLEAQEAYKQWFIDKADLIEKYTIGNDYNNESFWNQQLKHLNEAIDVRDVLTDKLLTEDLIGLLCDQTSLGKLQESARDIISRQNKEDISIVLQEGTDFINQKSKVKSFKELLCGVSDVLHAANDLKHLVMECNIYAIFDMEPSDVYSSIKTLVTAKEQKDKYNRVIVENNELISLFGEQEDWSSVIVILEYVNAMAINQDYKSKFTDDYIKYFCDSQVAREQVAQRLDKLRDLYPHLEEQISEFVSIFPDEDKLIERPLSLIADRYNKCMNNIEQLDMWLNYNDARKECIACGLENYVCIMEERNGKIKDAEGCFRYSFFQRWCQAVIASKPSIARFKKFTQDEAVNEFCKLDVEQFATAQQRIRAKIIDTYPDPNTSTAAGDEMSILQRELNKKAKIMPLRKLFRTIPNLLLRLKPCLMMSPLSVSYFLEADSYHFDMVIFDEASQVFPQDALGSVMRAKQVIIAGDTRQLPPTNFFSSNTANKDADFDSEDDEDDFIDEEISDSILEEADKVMRSSTLLWHYRSQNEQLIAFSNQEIYDNRLITFPGCKEHMKDTGVEFVYVKDGLYEGKPKNCNVLEAKKCVQLIEEHIKCHPSRSLGIIAFSEKQQQAILDEIQDFRELHPEYEFYFSEDKPDPFFVKNLENVQGDERDTIFFSVGYGYTKEQREKNKPMALRFGPLGRSGGERRLNVAITRAKVNIKLIASILPKDINLEKTDSTGIKLLHDYLNFARLGTDALHSSNDDTEHDIMCSVIKDFLVENGYSVTEKLGCSGYKIDLAVIHPQNPECYLANVECDGASFADAQTARERERLRKDVLERMGWYYYRVWSSEWVKNPDVEGKKLLAFLKEAEQRPFDYSSRSNEQISDQYFNDLVEEVVDKQEADEVNKYGFDEYVEADLYHTPPTRKGYSVTLNDHILYAVSIEQPISMDLLCQRLAPVLGFNRVTTRVTTAVEYAVYSLKDKLDKKDGFITMKGFINPIVRIPAYGEEQRSINNIAPCELMEAMRTVAKKSFGLNRDDLINETSKALGYARKGPRIQTVLESILGELIKRNIIHMVDEKVHTVEATIYG